LNAKKFSEISSNFGQDIKTKRRAKRLAFSLFCTLIYKSGDFFDGNGFALEGFVTNANLDVAIGGFTNKQTLDGNVFPDRDRTHHLVCPQLK